MHGDHNDSLGATLGGVLEGYIGQMETEEAPREVILGKMGEAAGLPLEQVSAIVQGQDVPVTAGNLEAFCKVLGCPLSELVAAAEADGIDFAAAGEEPPAEEAPADAPAGAPAAMSVAMARRRLDLKTKGSR